MPNQMYPYTTGITIMKYAEPCIFITRNFF